MTTRFKTRQMSRTVRQHRADGQEARRKILSAAVTEFAERGFEGASLRTIASVAGTAMPSIYFYFKDKRELYLRCCADLFAPTSQLSLEALRTDGPAADRLYDFLFVLATEFVARPNLLRLILRELVDWDRPGWQALREEAWGETFAALQKTISEATGRPESAAEPIVVYMVSLGLVQYVQLGGDVERDLKKIIRQPKTFADYVFDRLFPELPRRRTVARRAIRKLSP